MELRQEKNRELCVGKLIANVGEDGHDCAGCSQRVARGLRGELEEIARERGKNAGGEVETDKLLATERIGSGAEAVQHVHVGEEVEHGVVAEGRKEHRPADGFGGGIAGEVAEHERLESWHAPSSKHKPVERQNRKKDLLARGHFTQQRVNLLVYSVQLRLQL